MYSFTRKEVIDEFMKVSKDDGKLPMENKIEEKDIVDLNDAEFQTKLMNYALFGVPSKDRQGHKAVIQFRTHPFQPDYFEYLKAKAPKNTW
ncbi:unnamed protein product, partial [marine sediment metagenome]